MEAYSFSSLRSLVEETFDVDVDQFESSFQFEPITIEIHSHEFEDKIELSDEGIFYRKDGNLIKGFLYIERGYNPLYNESIIPKFHVSECRTITNQRNRHNFDGHYVFSNVPVKMTDLDEIEKDLPLCRNCLNYLPEINEDEAAIINGRVINTEEYNDLILNNPEVTGNLNNNRLPSNSFEKVIEWGHCRREYIDLKSYFYEKQFTCENCQLNLEGAAGFFLEIQFRDGNKSNKSIGNLECLCPECYISAGHEYNQDKFELFKQLRDNILLKENQYAKIADNEEPSLTDDDAGNYQVDRSESEPFSFELNLDESRDLFNDIVDDKLKDFLIDTHIKYRMHRDRGEVPEACRHIIRQLDAFFVFYEHFFVQWIEHCRPKLRVKLVGERISNFYNKYWVAKEYFEYEDLDCDMLNKVYAVRNGASHAPIGDLWERYVSALNEVSSDSEAYFNNLENFIDVLKRGAENENILILEC